MTFSKKISLPKIQCTPFEIFLADALWSKMYGDVAYLTKKNKKKKQKKKQTLTETTKTIATKMIKIARQTNINKDNNNIHTGQSNVSACLDLRKVTYQTWVTVMSGEMPGSFVNAQSKVGRRCINECIQYFLICCISFESKISYRC